MPRWSKFPAYVSAADKRARVAAAAARLQTKKSSPDAIRIEGRQITTTFWGRAWCDNLQSYADFAHRLERGRSYVRGGAVVDLKIAAGQITARVAGTRLYKVEITMAPLARKRWHELARACTGRIGSLVALLRGEIPDEVMRAVTDRTGGLFPAPDELDLSCDCPDHAGLCKHIAASLYGVGARFDQSPELLFLLRGVDAKDLIEQASARLGRAGKTSAATLAASTSDLAALFGIELTDVPLARPRKPRK